MATLQDLVEQQNKIELQIYEKSLELLRPLYDERRQFIKTVPQFWPTVIETSELLAEYITYEDTEAIDSLQDIFIEWSNDNVKNFAVTFHFGDNAYFGPVTLEKDFIFNTETEKYVSKPVNIPWHPGKDLTKQQPGRDTSFFNWFGYEGTGDDVTEATEIAQIITEELYPHALKIYQTSQQEDVVEEYDLSEDDVDESS